MHRNYYSNILLGLTFAALVLFGNTSTGEASIIDDLRNKLTEKLDAIKKIDQEINTYQTQIQKTTQEAKTLQTAVVELDTTGKKLGADLRVTENKIDYEAINIEKLGHLITENNDKIRASRQALSASLKNLHSADNHSLVEIALKYNNLATFWNEVASIQKFQEEVNNRVDQLKDTKYELEINKAEREQSVTKLQQLKSELADRKQLVEQNKKEKSSLLTQTKEQEAAYLKMLSDAVARRKAFEQELFNIESQLRLQIDPNSIPSAGKGILVWPVTPVRVTQEFGDTEFARTNPQAYNGKGHNGVDFGAPNGTPVKAAASGTILGTGDTDAACPRASYGKWVLIKHTNGLTSLYAHLSLIKTSSGEQVNAGDVIGYVGNTGYSTGPHLHFTVYASQGVQIIQRPSVACGGKIYTIPVADFKAYLNPLLYL